MKNIILVLALLSFAIVSATPTYYPNTILVEDFAASWCVTCLDAFAGLDILDENYHAGEQFSVRYFTESADLSNPEVDARFEHYEVYGVPSVFFNGKFRVDGGGENIADGSIFTQKLQPFLYHGAPMKIEFIDWNPNTGAMEILVTMVNANQNVNDQNIRFLLLEDDVATNATSVVRSIVSEPITINGIGATASFTHTFTLNPLWDNSKLWAAAFVQMNDDTVLQAAHTKALPEINLRAAMDWDNDIVGAANTTYLSQPFYFFNLGNSEDYLMQIVVDDAPSDWYFNYCDEEGFCYPGSVQLPLNLSAGEMRPYHLNLMVGNSGTAYFHWEVTSASLGTYIIPFRYRTDDVSNEDQTLLPRPIVLGKNYPNPFAGKTTIPVYSEKGNTAVTIEIYNVKGQKVKEISSQSLQSGTNQIELNMGDNMANGIYYYRLKDQSHSPVRKMLISR